MERDTKTNTQEDVKTEAEIGVRYLQAKECQGLPETPEVKRKVRNTSPLEPSVAL